MKLFVSYRRGDTQDFAGRLADRLRESAGVKDVFLDVDGIEPGENFETKLKTALAQCDLCLVVIGLEWRGVRSDGQGARIDEPGDFVRLEVREALASPVKVIPVLANGAAMPGPGCLPDDLAELVKLNAVSVRHADFGRDVDYLLDVMFSRRKPGPSRAYLARHPIQAGMLRGAVGLALALAGLLTVAAVHLSLTGQSLDEAVGGPGPTVLLIVAVLAAGATLPGFLHRRRLRRAPRAR